MVRLVFRRYRQVRQTICTSVLLRSSTRVSTGFNLLTHSSPSFGSQQVRSNSTPKRAGQKCNQNLIFLFFNFFTHMSFNHSNTCILVRLLGPCYKTGHTKPLRRYLILILLIFTTFLVFKNTS